MDLKEAQLPSAEEGALKQMTGLWSKEKGCKCVQIIWMAQTNKHTSCLQKQFIKSSHLTPYSAAHLPYNHRWGWRQLCHTHTSWCHSLCAGFECSYGIPPATRSSRENAKVRAVLVRKHKHATHTYTACLELSWWPKGQGCVHAFSSHAFIWTLSSKLWAKHFKENSA